MTVKLSCRFGDHESEQTKSIVKIDVKGTRSFIQVCVDCINTFLLQCLVHSTPAAAVYKELLADGTSVCPTCVGDRVNQEIAKHWPKWQREYHKILATFGEDQVKKIVTWVIAAGDLHEPHRRPSYIIIAVIAMSERTGRKPNAILREIYRSKNLQLLIPEEIKP